MKFLYIATERSDGQAAATALRGVDPHVTVFWVTQFDHGARWIKTNMDVSACLVEPGAEPQSCAAFLSQVRNLGLTVPVIVIAPDVGFRLEWLKAGADDYVAKNHSLLRELPIVVTRALERVKSRKEVTVPVATTRAASATPAEATPANPVAQSQNEFEAKLAELVGRKVAVERRLADAEASFRQGEQAWIAERSAGAERHARLEERIRHERAIRADLEQQLTAAKSALHDVEKQHQSALKTTTQQLAESRAQHEITAARAAATWAMVDEQLREAVVEVERARQNQAAAVADAERHSRRESELSAQLTALTTSKNTLEGRLADVESGMAAAHERIAQERLVAAEQRQQVEERLAEAIQARETAEARLTVRESEFAAMLAEASSSRDALEQRLSAAMSAFKDADERYTRDRLTAIRKAAEREAELDTALRDERGARAGVEQKLADAAAASLAADRQHASELEAAAAKLSAEQTRLETELAQLVSARDSLQQQLNETVATADQLRGEHASITAEIARLTQREAQLSAQLADAATARRGLELQIATSTIALSEAEERAASERRDASERQAALQATLHTEIEKREGLETEVARAGEKIVRLEDQIATERSDHESRAAEIKEEIRNVTRERDTLQESYAALQADVGRAVVEQQEARERLTAQHAAVVAALEAVVGERDTQLKEQAAQHAAATQSAESARALLQDGFRSTLAARNHEIEQLQAKVDAAVEELESARHRLDRAHRMEAVARLASEIAATCGNLLRDVRHNAQQWLNNLGEDASLRQQGEMMLDDVTRASGFLRQLAVYGDEQSNALVPVDLNKVLRDLAPVLNRLAGDDVEIELPKTSASFRLDVRAQHVERLLVTLASYGRQRMRSGGRLRIELKAVDLDQSFVEKYPNVRQGRHVLMTVTEIRRAPRADDPLQLRAGATGAKADTSSDRPGVDLGVLQELIGECSGHLWMTVEPPGNMVAKIHLPLRTSHEFARARKLVKRAVTALRAPAGFTR